PPNPPQAGAMENQKSDALEKATERVMLTMGLTRRRERRRIQAEILKLVSAELSAGAVADRLIARFNKSARERAEEDMREREAQEESRERASWIMWKSMPDSFKAENPWRGKVFEELLQ
ncbi:MAG: hypothetical protein WB424_01845, partial [Terracidiphilus sp.]